MGRNWLEINGGFYALNMPSEKLSLQRDFEACGLEDASLMLELWTRSKRRTNITALSGVFAPWLWAGTGVLSFVAAGQRTLLYDQLLSWSPEEPDTRLL